MVVKLFSLEEKKYANYVNMALAEVVNVPLRDVQSDSRLNFIYVLVIFLETQLRAWHVIITLEYVL